MAEAEGEGEGEKKKGGKKKLVIMIVVLLAIGYEAATMTVLKPPPLTAAEKAAKAAKEKYALETKCAEANGVKPPAPPEDANAKKDSAGTTTTTLAMTESTPTGESLPVLLLDSVTVNLADGHFLKMGVGVQFPAKTVIDTIKTDNPGAAALSYIISTMRTKSSAELGPKALEPLRKELGYAICSDPSLNAGGQILSIFFTDFVTQ